MRAVIQRVDGASVSVDGRVVARISRGLMVLVGVENSDTGDDLAFVKRKIVNLRVFDDPDGRMNLALREIGGSILLVSQFTLHGDTRRGNRPDFTRAAPAERARELYNQLVSEIRAEGIPVESGVFQAMMKVHLINDGPVTLIVDSRKEFF
ncbi:MAG: D-tyrosyl-tRNA(Tyr) deacylase [Acidobacteria bacterium]|nr:MAG: D-tyrosyl-tRNA(Tyr) deacylase [Acidobacteriota bacterium]